MIRRVAVSAVLLAASSVAVANTFTVRHTRSGGSGSLRWAIGRANGRAGGDDIRFKPGLRGRAILLRSPLPDVRDARTRIFGDTNDDGAPDIALNGRFAGPGSGLTIRADHCVIDGLAIANFEYNGIRLISADSCVIRSCHIGVNLAGTRAVRNGGHQIWVYKSDDNTIGGPRAAGRNVIAAGSARPERSGIHVLDSCRNHIRNNTIGLARDGLTPLTLPHDSGVGITLATSVPVVLGLRDGDAPATCVRTQDNLIGGTRAERNVIGSTRTGIRISNADANTVRNNYVGLAGDGRTVAGIGNHCIRVDGGSESNVLGGTLGYHGNVFAGGSYGVYITGAGTDDNTVRGSYFGLTASGTAQRRLIIGVAVSGSAGRQTIGGGSAGNFFCPKHPEQTTFGVLLFFGGEGTRVSENRFGLRPDGKPALEYDYGVSATDVETHVRGNLFRRANTAALFSGTPASSTILINSFHNCDVAVRLRNGAQALLGDLGNSNALDDGYNEFHSSNTWYIRNETSNSVKAEGNHFPPGFFDQIDEKIWDWRDDHSRGLVDYQPAHLDLPQSGPARLAVLSAVAAPAAEGADIAFSLSTSARVTVTVLNIAGRPVAAACRDREVAAGLQRVIWSGQTAQGLRAPGGMYLVRIVARDEEGRQAQSLCSVSLRR